MTFYSQLYTVFTQLMNQNQSPFISCLLFNTARHLETCLIHQAYKKIGFYGVGAPYLMDLTVGIRMVDFIRQQRCQLSPGDLISTDVVFWI